MPVSASSPALPGKWGSRSSINADQGTGLIWLAGGPAESPVTACKLHAARDRLPILSPAQILPLLQRNRYVAVFPKEIVEGAEIEFVALLHARVGDEFQDL